VPIYDYVCSSCRHRVEVIHGINDAGPRFCPSCGTEGTMRKALVSPAIHFKGSGWAKKDRSSTSGRSSKAGSSSGSSDGGSSDGGSSEAASPATGPADAKNGSTGASTAASGSED
jgi:putative FmdB family regulatory protein